MRLTKASPSKQATVAFPGLNYDITRFASIFKVGNGYCGINIEKNTFRPRQESQPIWQHPRIPTNSWNVPRKFPRNIPRNIPRKFLRKFLRNFLQASSTIFMNYFFCLYNLITLFSLYSILVGTKLTHFLRTM